MFVIVYTQITLHTGHVGTFMVVSALNLTRQLQLAISYYKQTESLKKIFAALPNCI